MTFLVPALQQHSVAIKVISACRMVHATYKGSVGLFYRAQVVPTGAGIHAAHILIAVGVISLVKPRHGWTSGK